MRVRSLLVIGLSMDCSLCLQWGENRPSGSSKVSVRQGLSNSLTIVQSISPVISCHADLSASVVL